MRIHFRRRTIGLWHWKCGRLEGGRTCKPFIPTELGERVFDGEGEVVDGSSDFGGEWVTGELVLDDGDDAAIELEGGIGPT